MKIVDIRKKTNMELRKLLAESEAEVRTFKFGMSGGHTKNVRRSRAVRKTIARIKTVVHEKK